MDRVEKVGNSSLIIELNKMFFFSMECGCQGFVIADSELDAIKKLEQQQNININKVAFGYRYENEEGMFDLQFWQVDKGEEDNGVFITEYW